MILKVGNLRLIFSLTCTFTLWFQIRGALLMSSSWRRSGAELYFVSTHCSSFRQSEDKFHTKNWKMVGIWGGVLIYRGSPWSHFEKMTAFANMSYVQFGSDRKDNLLGFQSHVWHDDIVLQTSFCRSSICWSVRYSTQKFHFAMPLCQMPPKTGNPEFHHVFDGYSQVPSPSFLESLSQNVIVETHMYIYSRWNSLGRSCPHFRKHKVNLGYPGTSLESNSMVALVQVFSSKLTTLKCKDLI